MNIQRKRTLRDNLLDQLDYELGESTRLFIIQRDYLSKEMGWKEELNVGEKTRENDQKVKTITDELLKLLEKNDS